MARITEKLHLAAGILEGEQIADLPPGYIAGLVETDQVTRNQVYQAVQRYGYRWQRGQWRRVMPRWLENAVKRYMLMGSKLAGE